MLIREPEKRLRPEIDLLLCCARRTLDATHAARANEILQGSVNWEFLFPLTVQNGLIPLLCEHLGASNAIPSQFRNANRERTLRALFLTAELFRITDRFCQKKIPALPYKGPVLSQMAYANPLLRQFDDLDVVVPQRFIANVYKEMATLGYQPKCQLPRLSTEFDEHIPGEYVFVHGTNRAMVEIHTECTLRHFPTSPDIEDMRRRSMEMTLEGRRIPTFGWADTLLMLCVHGAKDFWSRLLWVSDVAETIDRLSPADWERLSREAKRYNAERMLRLGLWLARTMFGSNLPASVLQDVKRDRVAARIGNTLREQLLCQKTQPQSIVWRSHYRIRMVQPTWRGIFYWLRLSTAPTEEDWTVASDRVGPRAQYALLRPLRLWRKYTRSN